MAILITGGNGLVGRHLQDIMPIISHQLIMI